MEGAPPRSVRDAAFGAAAALRTAEIADLPPPQRLALLSGLAALAADSGAFKVPPARNCSPRWVGARVGKVTPEFTS